MKKNHFLAACWLFFIGILPNSLFAQLSTCGINTVNNVNRLHNVKITGNSLLLVEAAPAGMPSGRVLRRDLTNNMTSTLIGGLDFPVGMDIHPTNGNLYVGERG
ncbi:MAG: hypothetical protein ACOVQA_06800, partial [Thermoflexibacteraceae bacterium]